MKLFRKSENREAEIASRVVARREMLDPMNVTMNGGATAQVHLSEDSAWWSEMAAKKAA